MTHVGFNKGIMNRGINIVLMCLVAMSAIGQSTIRGDVKNNNGEKLEFASIFLVGTSYGAVSQVDGTYTIEGVPTGAYTLKCTFLGYTPSEQEILVAGSEVRYDIVMGGDAFQLDEIEVYANRLDSETAYAYKTVNKEEIQDRNTGQDMPFLLRFQPSMVVTSDAGAGIGYTGARIRGSDPTRVNVTINGIPLNDSESQGVFWVDLPDLATSVKDIQIVRGVGPSTNGAGAFGGTIGVNTLDTRINSYVDATLGSGSYGTFRSSVALGTGLMNDRYTVDARYSIIKSDGYIDRASSDLSSWYFSAGRLTQNSSLRFLALSGHETTYQSWYGSPESRVNGDEGELRNHYNNNVGSLYNGVQDSINLFGSDRRFNYYQYENQVDDYRQTHLQLHSFNKLGDHFLFNGSLHYTKGKGFFEEFKADEDLEDYDISGGGSSDLVRRRWLDNDFYGLTFLASYDADDFALSLGGGANNYVGGHFGKVIDVDSGQDFDRDNRYYFNEGNKSDINVFLKGDYHITDRLTVFSDLQVRTIGYDVEGDDNDGVDISIEDDFTFFNPKAGFLYKINNQWEGYASFAVANKEPGRSDFTDNPIEQLPRSESLQDWEAGLKYGQPSAHVGVNLYYMNYKDQLVNTGLLNDVGSAIRINAPSSYRRGIELEVEGAQGKWQYAANATLSQNKISQVDEIIYDYTNGFEVITNTVNDVDISFSPSLIGAATLGYSPVQGFSSQLLWKYVGSQFLDNTSNDARMLDAYQTIDIALMYTPKIKKTRNVSLQLDVRNVLSTLYSANGYTYSYIVGDLITENFLYPQAERNFMLTLRVGL